MPNNKPEVTERKVKTFRVSDSTYQLLRFEQLIRDLDCVEDAITVMLNEHMAEHNTADRRTNALKA